jgi:FSR family fosmidomycin resistance protein-like MFS transporter
MGGGGDQYYHSGMNSSSSIQHGSERIALRRDAGVIGLVGGGHLISHFSQLLLAPLFPWLKTEFNVGYTELGFLMTIFFVVSCAVQALSGFAVDRFGPRPILFGGLALIGCSAFGYSLSTSYWMLAASAVIGGIGNGVFHPVDYTLLNRKISSARLGHAYSLHGITGSLGWALAPAILVPLTLAYSWRIAIALAGVLALGVLFVLILNRDRLAIPLAAPLKGAAASGGSFHFMKLAAVWMCFGFFFWYGILLSIVQAFAPGAARQLHEVPLALAGLCLTAYMLSSAAGMLAGGFLAADAARSERVVGLGFGVAAAAALVLALGSFPTWLVPVLFGIMGLASGIAGPSRDLLVKQATPLNASGRVYGVVYAGMDIGQAVSPLIFGRLMDHGQFGGVLLGLAAVQLVLIASASSMRRMRPVLLTTA